jgi:hypothetical protein
VCHNLAFRGDYSPIYCGFTGDVPRQQPANCARLPGRGRPGLRDSRRGYSDRETALAKRSKHFSLEDALSISVDRMQRNFEPMRRQVETWRTQQLQQRRQSRRLPRVHRGGIWRSRGIRCAECTSCTSIRSTRSSSLEPCGACRTRSPRHSRNSIRSRNSGQRRNWEAFLKPPLRRCDVIGSSPARRARSKCVDWGSEETHREASF